MQGIRTLRWILLAEALAFFTAALVHAGALLDGYAHAEARVAETVIGVILVAGLAVSAFRPAVTPWAALLAQGLAWVGTMIGAAMIAIGVGPQSTLDVAYHAVIITLLAVGLVVAVRAGRREREGAPGSAS